MRRIVLLASLGKRDAVILISKDRVLCTGQRDRGAKTKWGAPLGTPHFILLPYHPARSEHGIIQHNFHVKVADVAAIMAPQRNRVGASPD